MAKDPLTSFKRHTRRAPCIPFLRGQSRDRQPPYRQRSGNKLPSCRNRAAQQTGRNSTVPNESHAVNPTADESRTLATSVPPAARPPPTVSLAAFGEEHFQTCRFDLQSCRDLTEQQSTLVQVGKTYITVAMPADEDRTTVPTSVWAVCRPPASILLDAFANENTKKWL
jgi:hypothetical protein